MRLDTLGTGTFAKSEPASIYVGGELQGPFTALRAAVEREEGMFLLTGESGTGKSALLARLADELRVAGHKVVLTTPHNNAHLIAWLSGVHLAPGTLPPVLLIDEADQLTGEDLKKLALGMRVVLAGSDDLAQRVSDASRMALSRLSKEDTESLVRHRLTRFDQDTIARFPSETIAAIAREGKGLPRNAVQIAERASLIASMGNFPKVTPDDVRKAARSLGLGKDAAPSADRQSGGVGWAVALAASSVVLALALAGGLLLLPEYLPPTPEQAAGEAPPEPQPSPGRDVASLPSSAPSPAPTEVAPAVPSPPPSETTTAALPSEPPAAPEARDAAPEPSPPPPAPATETPTAAASPSAAPEAAPEDPSARSGDPEFAAPASETAIAERPSAAPEAAPEVPAARSDDRAPAAPASGSATAALPAPIPPEPSDVSGATSPIPPAETADAAAEPDQESAASTFPPIPQRRPAAPDRPAPPPRRFVADAPIPERKPPPPMLASVTPDTQAFTGSSVSPSPYCRPYRSRVDMTGTPGQVQGIACLDENGEWVLVQQERD